jgi:diguanylate cyclase (GGDEF)-like protein
MSIISHRLSARVSVEPGAPSFDNSVVTTSKPSSRKEIAAGALLSLVLIAAGILCTPAAGFPLPAIPGFMTAFGASMLVMNALLAALLLSKGAIEQRPDVVWLGAAYLFVAAIFVPLTLSFKDGFVPGALIGTPASSVWLWSAWHAGFGLAISWYAVSVHTGRKAPSTRVVIAAVTAFVLALAVLMTAGVDYLPALLWNGKTFFNGALNCIPVTLIAIDVVALAFCVGLLARTTEQLWVTVAMVAACFDLWLTVHGANRFALGWYLSKCGSFVTSFVVIVSLFLDIAKLYRESALANRALTELAHRDGLTGVRNRRFFDVALARDWKKALADRSPLSLLMVDIDYFKQYNDAYGHMLGDDCLKSVARCLSEAVGSANFVSRYGGEEFAILLPNRGALDAREVAERARAAIEALALPHQQSPHGALTISVGVATQIPDANGKQQTLLSNADSALYLAKKRGRNHVASATDARRGLVADPPKPGKFAANG